MADRRPNRISALILSFAIFLCASLAQATQPIPSDPAYENELVRKALDLKLDDDPYWRVLLHYRERTLGRILSRWKSDVDAADFFNSPQGLTHPGAELEATIRAFFKPPLAAPPGDSSDPINRLAQCRFIDRFRWLKERLAIDPKRLPEFPCPEFEQWSRVLSPESVTVIFSSYYLNNPSSLFGHTLLRLNHRTHGTRDPLLDYGVNYAARPTTTNGFLYGFLGLVGGFNGDFSNVPYYLKVQEYNDVESRDLWEYDLKLTGIQLDRMMTHLWATGRMQVPYYFLDRNCGYMLLGLLDAAEPSLTLTAQFQGIWVIPADTLRAITSRAGLTGKVSLRPSLSAKIRQARAHLNSGQRTDFYELVDHFQDVAATSPLPRIAALPPEQAAPTLDLALDYLRLLKTAQKGKLAPRQIAFQRELLSARAKMDVRPYEPVQDPAEVERLRPDLGHKTRRVSLAGGYNDQRGGFAELGLRPAFHDLAANSRGYPAQAQIEVMNLQLRYYARDAHFRVERADVIHILSLSPLDPLFKRMSWEARLGADPVRDVTGTLSGDVLEYKGMVGAGVSLAPLSDVLLYALGRGELGLSGAFAPHFRLGPSVAGGAKITPTDWLGLVADASYFKGLLGYTPGYYQASAQMRFTTTVHTELRLQYDLSRTAQQGKAVFHVYF
jgi:hypothetical protein